MILLRSACLPHRLLGSAQSDTLDQSVGVDREYFISMDQLTRKALHGILVVSIEQAVAAPLCTARMVDGGARVIKIERPDGDFARKYDDAALGDSSYFAWINHGKESLTLDFKQQEDAQLLRRIIADADVFVQNLAPDAAARAGFGSDALREKHPSLITCDISGYGDSPAMSKMRAYDLLVQAESGLVSISGAPGEYGRIGVSLCDIGAGVTAHAGILEALLLRGQTGKGSAVAVSLFDVAAEWMSVPLVHSETGGGAPSRVGLQHPSIAPYGAFPTNDGKLTLIAIQNEREWQRLCTIVLAEPEFAERQYYASNNLRVANREQLDNEISGITGTMSCEQLRAALNQARIAYGALNTVSELSRHPALRRRNIINSMNRKMSLPAHPNQRHEALNAGMESMVPSLGQHTKAIKEEFRSGSKSTTDIV